MNRRSFLASLIAGVTSLLLPKLPQLEPEPDSSPYWEGDIWDVQFYDTAVDPAFIQQYSNYSIVLFMQWAEQAFGESHDYWLPVGGSNA